MTSRFVRTVAVFLAGTLLLAGCAANTASDDGENTPVTLVFTHGTSDQSALGRAGTVFSEFVEDAGVGLSVQHHWAGSLTPSEEALDYVSSGISDIHLIVPSYWPQELPLSNALSPVLGSVPDPAAGLTLTAGSAAYQEILQSGPGRAEFEEHGVVPLISYVADYNYLNCTEPVTTLAEAQGKRVRTPGPMWSDAFESLGMVPVSMGSADMYEGLQRGVIDCVAYGTALGGSSGIYEVAKHIMMLPFPPAATLAVMNMATYEGLSEKQREVVSQGMARSQKALLLNSLGDAASVFEEGGQAETQGVEIHPATELLESMLAHQDDVVANTLNQEVPGVAREDLAGIVDAHDAALERWVPILEAEGFPTETARTPADLIAQIKAAADPEAFDDFYSELAKLSTTRDQ